MPMRDALSLDDLNLFVFMAEEGSISGASRRFGISKAMFSRALARLEERAGLPLFDRVAGGLRLTATGQALEPVAQRLARTSSEAEEILRAAVGEPSGQLRVAASALSGQLLIAPVIAELHRLHPGVQVVVTVSALGPDPLSEDLDVVLRLGRPPEPYLIARKIASSPLALYASRPVAEALNRSRALEQVDAQRIVIGVPGVPADWDMHDGSGVTHTLRGAPKSVVGDPSVAPLASSRRARACRSFRRFLESLWNGVTNWRVCVRTCPGPRLRFLPASLPDAPAYPPFGCSSTVWWPLPTGADLRRTGNRTSRRTAKPALRSSTSAFPWRG